MNIMTMLIVIDPETEIFCLHGEFLPPEVTRCLFQNLKKMILS